jgi:hypothetical protein
VTILFSALIVIGVIEMIALVVVSVALSRSDRESDRDVVSPRLMGQAVALLAVGLGGLAMTVGDTGTLGFALVGAASWILGMVVMCGLVLPFANSRRPNHERPD